MKQVMKRALSGLFLFLFISSSIFSASFADSTIATNSTHKTEQSPVTANVNFVIRVPYKLSLISADKKIFFNSNTGNLLVTNQLTNSSNFISQTQPVQLQQSSQGQYTIASP